MSCCGHREEEEEEEGTCLLSPKHTVLPAVPKETNTSCSDTGHMWSEETTAEFNRIDVCIYVYCKHIFHIIVWFILQMHINLFQEVKTTSQPSMNAFIVVAALEKYTDTSLFSKTLVTVTLLCPTEAC